MDVFDMTDEDLALFEEWLMSRVDDITAAN